MECREFSGETMFILPAREFPLMAIAAYLMIIFIHTALVCFS